MTATVAGASLLTEGGDGERGDHRAHRGDGDQGPTFSLRWTERAGRCFLEHHVRQGDRQRRLRGCRRLRLLHAGRRRPVGRRVGALTGAGTAGPQTPTAREEFLEQMRIGVVFPFSPGPLAVLDVALWDLAARRAGSAPVPVPRRRPGVDPRLRVAHDDGHGGGLPRGRGPCARRGHRSLEGARLG